MLGVLISSVSQNITHSFPHPVRDTIEKLRKHIFPFIDEPATLMFQWVFRFVWKQSQYTFLTFTPEPAPSRGRERKSPPDMTRWSARWDSYFMQKLSPFVIYPLVHGPAWSAPTVNVIFRRLEHLFLYDNEDDERDSACSMLSVLSSGNLQIFLRYENPQLSFSSVPLKQST